MEWGPSRSFDELCGRVLPLVEAMTGVRSRAEAIVINPELDYNRVDAAWNAASREIQMSVWVRDSLTAVLDGSTLALEYVRPAHSQRLAHRAGYAAQALLDAALRSLSEPTEYDPTNRVGRERLVEAMASLHLERFIRDLGLLAIDPRVGELGHSNSEQARIDATLSELTTVARSVGVDTDTLLVRQLTGRRVASRSTSEV